MQFSYFLHSTYVDLEACRFNCACCSLLHLSWLWPLHAIATNTCCSTNEPLYPLSCHCQVNIATYCNLPVPSCDLSPFHTHGTRGIVFSDWFGRVVFKSCVLLVYYVLFLHPLENTQVHSPSPSSHPMSNLLSSSGVSLVKTVSSLRPWNGYWSKQGYPGPSTKIPGISMATHPIISIEWSYRCCPIPKSVDWGLCCLSATSCHWPCKEKG